MYLHCSECRLTVYRPVELSAVASCPRCGREAQWSSPPFARTDELRFKRARDREDAPRLTSR